MYSEDSVQFHAAERSSTAVDARGSPPPAAPRSLSAPETAMIPHKWVLWMHSRRVAELCPGLFLSACEAYSRLQEIKGMLSRSGANFCSPCARGRGRHDCGLQQHMDQWNNLLTPIKAQLREGNILGELALLCFDHRPHVPEATFRIQRAVLLLHWILTKHTCTTTLRVFHLGIFKTAPYFALLCDGLLQCHHLRSLKLCADFQCGTKVQSLLGAMRNMRDLEEFAFYKQDFSLTAVKMADLCDLIVRNGKLTRLEVNGVDDVTTSLGCFPRAVARKVCLTKLCLDVSCLRQNECGLFGLALKANRSLKSLRLLGSLRKPALSFRQVARALDGVTSLTSLELAYFRVTVGEAWALVTYLMCNNSLQHLALFACAPTFSHVSSVPCSGESGEDSWSVASWHMHPFVHMLRKFTSLRELTFPLSSYPPDDQRAFLEALAENNSIGSVQVQSLSHSYVSDLCRLVCETGTDSRVRLHTASIELERLDSASYQTYTRNVRGQICHRVDSAEMYSRFTQLLTLKGVTALSVHLQSAIDAEWAEVFGQYLRNTQLLNDASMIFSARRKEALVLIDALSHNTSITDLTVEKWCQSRRTARLLADVVCSSKKILLLTYNSASGKPSPAFFPALARHIERNSTILSVKTADNLKADKNWSHIQAIVTRNHALLVHAAQFVTGCALQKSGAEALELLSSNSMLLMKVQEMTSECESEAKDAIKRRLTDLDDLHFFMRTAGVVSERVVCTEGARCRACLGTLPAECWLGLRQYIRVADVVDSLEEC